MNCNSFFFNNFSMKTYKQLQLFVLVCHFIVTTIVKIARYPSMDWKFWFYSFLYNNVSVPLRQSTDNHNLSISRRSQHFEWPETTMWEIIWFCTLMKLFSTTNVVNSLILPSNNLETSGAANKPNYRCWCEEYPQITFEKP